MKKIIYLIIIGILCGCSSKKINVENPISIVYNDYNLVEKDYDSIVNMLNEINFSCGKKQSYEGNVLTITTDTNFYQFHISNNYYMEFQKNDKYCYTKETEKVKNMFNFLNQKLNEYTDLSFFTIYSEINYINNNNDMIIKLDKNDNFIIINTTLPIKNFKINEIEYDKKTNNYIETDLLYSYEQIKNNQTIIIRKEILQKPNFIISFINTYNYFVTILPIINENNEINFITNIDKK